jgi:glycosyltransferase involved in cell wall biosynthesis
MGRLAHLKETLPLAMAQKDCEYVLVDWSCPEKSGEWAKAQYPQITVVSVPGKKFFNLSGARNIGSKAVTSDKICFIDCDMKMKPGFADELIKRLKPGCWAQGTVSGCLGFAGTILCWKEDWKKIGGFDEEMEGWGREDLDFKQRLHRSGLTEVRYDSRFIDHIGHEWDLRVQNYEEKNTQVTVARHLRRIVMKRYGKIKSPVYSN